MRRWWVWPLLALPGGLVGGLVFVSIDLWLTTKLKGKSDMADDSLDTESQDLSLSDVSTNDPRLDALRFPVIYGTLRAGLTNPAAIHAIAHALMTIAAVEGSFDGAVGDTDPATAPGGPSISPWQIERVNAIAYQWYMTPAPLVEGSQADRDTYAAITTTGRAVYDWAAHAAIFFLHECWEPSGGDFRIAFGLWNGGPKWQQFTGSTQYAQKALAFAQAQGWA